jgi:hypothetical protein
MLLFPFSASHKDVDELRSPRKAGNVMNYEFSYDQRLRLLRISFRGNLNDANLNEATRKLREVGQSVDPERVLSDFSGVTTLDIASETVNSLAHLRPVFGSKVAQVIFAPQDHVFGMARMFQALSADQRPTMVVVRNLKEAYRILGIAEDPKFEPLKVA